MRRAALASRGWDEIEFRSMMMILMKRCILWVKRLLPMQPDVSNKYSRTLGALKKMARAGDLSWTSMASRVIIPLEPLCYKAVQLLDIFLIKSYKVFKRNSDVGNYLKIHYWPFFWSLTTSCYFITSLSVHYGQVVQICCLFLKLKWLPMATDLSRLSHQGFGTACQISLNSVQPWTVLNQD